MFCKEQPENYTNFPRKNKLLLNPVRIDEREKFVFFSFVFFVVKFFFKSTYPTACAIRMNAKLTSQASVVVYMARRAAHFQFPASRLTTPRVATQGT